MPVQRVPRQTGLDAAKPVRYRRLPVPDVSTGGGSGPTFIINDYIGFKDVPTWAWNLPDAVGYKDAAMTWGLNPTDNIGFIDALAITGTMELSDRIGFKDTFLLGATELPVVRASGHAAFDSDAWGDSWVDRTAVTGVNVNHGNEATMVVANVAALGATENAAIVEIDFTRFAGFSASGTSTLTFLCQWPTVALSPSANMIMALKSNATRPFVESTVTANTFGADFGSAAPYTNRVIPFPQDGTLRTHVITFTTAEVNDFLGKWLLLLFATDALTLGTFTLFPREAASSANLTTYDLHLTR